MKLPATVGITKTIPKALKMNQSVHYRDCLHLLRARFHHSSPDIFHSRTWDIRRSRNTGKTVQRSPHTARGSYNRSHSRTHSLRKGSSCIADYTSLGRLTVSAESKDHFQKHAHSVTEAEPRLTS